MLLPFIIWLNEGLFAASYNDLSNAGDWLGGTSAPLFSLAGFILMYAAYKAQKEELALTRQEMNDTRKELKTQNETLSHQRFENTFLICLHSTTKS